MWAIFAANSRRPRSSSCSTPCGASGSGSCPRIGKRGESVVATRARCKVGGHHGCGLGGGGRGGVRRGARPRSGNAPGVVAGGGGRRGGGDRGHPGWSVVARGLGRAARI